MIQVLNPEWVLSIFLVVFDFDGVLTDNRVWVFEDGSEAVCCSRSDGIGLAKLREKGLEVIVISTETNKVVQARTAKLKLECAYGVENKLEYLRKLVKQKGLNLSQVAFVGNDINDKECLENVGLPIVVADAHPDVMSLGKVVTSLKGGQGAVREICDAWVEALKKITMAS